MAIEHLLVSATAFIRSSRKPFPPVAMIRNAQLLQDSRPHYVCMFCVPFVLAPKAYVIIVLY
jgi:hypothetical protein